MDFNSGNKTGARTNIVVFSLFSAWMLAIIFEGQVLYSLAEEVNADGSAMALTAILAQFIGLFCSGFFIKRHTAAKMTMITSTVVCIAGSLIFFLPFSGLWYIALIAMAFFAGLYIASWGFFFKAYTLPGQRLKTAADVLIFSNILMIFINVIAVNYSAYVGLFISVVFLVSSLLLFFRLDASACAKTDKVYSPANIGDDFSMISKPLIILCLFIFVITINSGFMYQVVNPSFAHHALLTSYYWAVPYILVLFVLRNLPPRINQAYIMYVAMTMIGLAYILFLWLDKSATSYLLIDTLMLGAFGVCDLFWWSILGSLLDYTDNPGQILGLGLSMNVLGIIGGGFIGNWLMLSGGSYLNVSIIALAIIFAVLIMLPVLNIQLTKLLQDHAFLVRFAASIENSKDKDPVNYKDNKLLTAKEMEVVRLLLKGYTYKAIAENLYITENTMKYHIKNIYQKLNISNKMELIKKFTKVTN